MLTGDIQPNVVAAAVDNVVVLANASLFVYILFYIYCLYLP